MPEPVGEDHPSVVAIDRWAKTASPNGLIPSKGEYAEIARFLGALRHDPPVVTGRTSRSRADLVPMAAEYHRRRGTPYKGFRYALRCIGSVLEEWSVRGVVEDAADAGPPAWVDPFPNKGGEP